MTVQQSLIKTTKIRSILAVFRVFTGIRNLLLVSKEISFHSVNLCEKVIINELQNDLSLKASL